MRPYTATSFLLDTAATFALLLLTGVIPGLLLMLVTGWTPYDRHR